MQFSKNSKEYVRNGIYNISGITFYTLWAWKNTSPKYSTVNTPAKNTVHSNELTGLGYPSIQTIPDIGSFDFVKAFPQTSIEFFFLKLKK